MVSDAYKRAKLQQWCPTWNADTINSMKGTQLHETYRRIQDEVAREIEAKYGYAN